MPIPREYPDGVAGEFLRDPASQPLSLLLGAIAMYGSDSPWSLPHTLATRLGMERFDAMALAGMGEAALRQAIAKRPSLHIDSPKMGRWADQASRMVVGQYGGGTSWIWDDYRRMDAARLVERLRGVPGIGAVKALVFAFLLGTDWGADIVGWDKFEMPMDPPMLEASRRLGIGTSLPRGDPERLVRIHEGLRNIVKRHCALDGPRCEACPLSAKCPRQGV